MKIKINSMCNFEDIHSKYEISNDGKFFVDGNEAKGSVTKKGYIQVRLQTRDKRRVRCFKLHRLIATAFVVNPNPELFDEVNHENGIKSCNADWNLKWTDRLGNQNHAFLTGLWDANRKLCKKEVEDILIDAHSCLMSLAEIAKKYNVHRTTISDVFYARHYKDILTELNYSTPFDFAEEFHKKAQKKSSLTDEQVLLICELLQLGKNYSEILEHDDLLNEVPLHILKDIKRRKGYLRISSSFNW